MPATPEDPIHLNVLHYLRAVLPHAAIHHSPNELGMSGPQAMRIVGKAKARGMRPGWPDIEVIVDGRVLFFEVKAAGGALSKPQKETRQALIDAGARWALVRSMDDAREALALWGVQTREVMP